MARFNDGTSGGGVQPSLGTSLMAPIQQFSAPIFHPTVQRSYTPTTYRPATNYSAPRNTGYSSGGGGGGGGTSYASTAPSYTPAAPVTPPVTPPPPPQMTLDQYLANDTTYGAQQNDYQKALSDYKAQYAGEQNKYTNEYNAAEQKMGVDKTLNQRSMTDDYAGRGMLNSGLWARALNEFQNQYDTRQGDLDRAKGNYMSDLATNMGNFQSQQQLGLDKAKQDAMQRYAMKIGVPAGG